MIVNKRFYLYVAVGLISLLCLSGCGKEDEAPASTVDSTTGVTAGESTTVPEGGTTTTSHQYLLNPTNRTTGDSDEPGSTQSTTQEGFDLFGTTTGTTTAGKTTANTGSTTTVAGSTTTTTTVGQGGVKTTTTTTTTKATTTKKPMATSQDKDGWIEGVIPWW